MFFDGSTAPDCLNELEKYARCQEYTSSVEGNGFSVKIQTVEEPGDVSLDALIASPRHRSLEYLIVISLGLSRDPGSVIYITKLNEAVNRVLEVRKADVSSPFFKRGIKH